MERFKFVIVLIVFYLSCLLIKAQSEDDQQPTGTTLSDGGDIITPCWLDPKVKPENCRRKIRNPAYMNYFFSVSFIDFLMELRNFKSGMFKNRLLYVEILVSKERPDPGK